MKIRQLENAQYAGRRFTARYQTNGYYEITAAEGGFRISNLCVFDKAARGQGIGSMLMARITEAARARGARMLVLETQSCNEAAIAFYRKNGFSVIGFDLYAYSNADPERREVRIEMGKKLQDAVPKEEFRNA